MVLEGSRPPPTPFINPPNKKNFDFQGLPLWFFTTIWGQIVVKSLQRLQNLPLSPTFKSQNLIIDKHHNFSFNPCPAMELRLTPLGNNNKILGSGEFFAVFCLTRTNLYSWYVCRLLPKALKRYAMLRWLLPAARFQGTVQVANSWYL